MDDVLARFAALHVEPEPVRTVRGVGLAVAEHWLVTLPEVTDKQREIKQRAILGLADVTDLACSVYDLAD